MNILIDYKSGQASYTVIREKPGLYTATLQYYHGNKNNIPPVNITLVRGIRNWTGSDEDVVLIHKIGEQIEDRLDEEGRERRRKALI